MRVRFAPSPTGQLHVGNARTALFNWLLARGHRGTFVLRIEDTDRERSTVESEQAILEDLAWLGLTWDEGPDHGGPCAPYRQSERLQVYEETAGRLRREGHAYYCFCAPADLEVERQRAMADRQVPRYSGRCRSLDPADAEQRHAAGEAAAVRFRVPEAPDTAFDDVVRGRIAIGPEMLGDFVLLRADGHPAYNFAVVVDDVLMRITHVVRGEDHVSNTHRQVLLYRALGEPTPVFAHLSLVLGPDHTPLSKRHGATSVAEFRARGYLPEALVNHLALIGWSPGGEDELLGLDELARRFSLEDVGRSAGVFDLEKLAWANRHYLRQIERERLTALALPYFERAGWATRPTAIARDFLGEVAEASKTKVDRLELMPDRFACIVRFDVEVLLSRSDLRAELDGPAARQVLEALAAELAAASPVADGEAFKALAARVKARSGQKGRGLFHPLRLALTGADAGPELEVVVPLIERGARLPADAGVPPIVGCLDRVRAVLAAIASPA